MVTFESFWNDYELYANNISASRHKFFSNNLRRWLLLLDSQPEVAKLVSDLESCADFENWYQQALATMGSMAGSADLDWPIGTDKRLGAQLGLMRAFADKKIEVWDFAANFLGDTNFDIATSEITIQIFQPLRVELAQYLSRKLQQKSFAEPLAVPAADRVVPLTHNSVEFTRAIEAIESVERALSSTNDYQDVDDKAQRLAELSAGKTLLHAPRIRIAGVRTVLLSALSYLADKFMDNAVGALAGAALAAVLAYIGIHL